MKRIVSLVLAVLLVICLFAGCNSAPSDKEVYDLVQKAIDTILLYTDYTPSKIIKQEFPGTKVVYDVENGYVTDLDYSDFLAKYGQIFDEETLKTFADELGKEQDGKLAVTGWEFMQIMELSDINLEFISKNGNEFSYYLEFTETHLYTEQTFPPCLFEIKIIRTDEGLRFSGPQVVFYFFQNAKT